MDFSSLPQEMTEEIFSYCDTFTQGKMKLQVMYFASRIVIIMDLRLQCLFGMERNSRPEEIQKVIHNSRCNSTKG